MNLGQGKPREEVWERSWGRCQGLQPLNLLILVEGSHSSSFLHFWLFPGQNEILGSSIEDFKEASEERRAMAPLPEGRNLFSYRSFRPNEWLKPKLGPWIFAFTALPPRPKRHNIVNEPQSPYSLSPVSSKSQKLLRWSSLTTTIMCFVATYNWFQEPEKGFAQDLQNSFQSPGRSWAAGRLLPQSGECTHCQICEELLRLSNTLLACKRLTGAVKMCWALDSEPVYTFGQPAQVRYHICGTNTVSHLKNIGSISLV